MASESGDVFDDFGKLVETVTTLDINDILTISSPIIQERHIGDWGITGDLEKIFIEENLKYNLSYEHSYQFYYLKLKTKYKNNIELAFFKKSAAFAAYEQLISAFNKIRS